MIKCYHFCSNDFLNKLLKDKIIYSDNDLRLLDDEPASYAKKHAFSTKKLNNGKGMFFAWSNPFYKGEVYFNEKGSYNLLELNIENEDIIIKTHYENWCSLGMDIYDADGDLDVADKYCREEYDMKNGLEDSYTAIFDTSDPLNEIQILLPFIKEEWIRSAKKCINKHI